jgi:hypothetical protein
MGGDNDHQYLENKKRIKNNNGVFVPLHTRRPNHIAACIRGQDAKSILGVFRLDAAPVKPEQLIPALPPILGLGRQTLILIFSNLRLE